MIIVKFAHKNYYKTDARIKIIDRPALGKHC